MPIKVEVTSRHKVPVVRIHSIVSTVDIECADFDSAEILAAEITASINEHSVEAADYAVAPIG